MINWKTVRTSGERGVRELEGGFAEPGKPGAGPELRGRQPVLKNILGMLSHPFPCRQGSMGANERAGFTVPGKGRQRLLGLLLYGSLFSILLMSSASKPAVRSLWRNSSRKVFSKAF